MKEALLTIGCYPIEQSNFAPDWRTVEGMLRGKIANCQALIHIAGLRYGAEPDPGTLPSGTPRRSYTQMEYHLGCHLHNERGDSGFRVYTFICPENYPFDPEPNQEAKKKRGLQRKHRTALLDSPRLYEIPQTKNDLRSRILALREAVLSIEQEQIEVKEEVRSLRKPIFIALALILLLLGVTFGAYKILHQDSEGVQQRISEIKAGQNIDAVRIKTHLREASERKLAEDLAAADKAAKSDDREHLREAAQAANQARIARIDDLAIGFALLEGTADATEESKEMTRILKEEGVDAALGYIEAKRDTLLQRVAASKAAHEEEVRTQLQPLLQAAGLQATKGDTADARKSYEELLKLDAQWPQALDDFACLLCGQSNQSVTEAGDVRVALDDARACLVHARRLYEEGPTQTRAQRLLLGAHIQMADVLTLRRQAGDAQDALEHYTRGLELGEKILQDNPNSAEAMHNMSVCLGKLGDFLVQRGHKGDTEAALRDYTRGLELGEKILQDNPNSTEAMREVSATLITLGDFLVQRGQKGDTEAALRDYTRGLELREKILQDNPNSTEAMREVSATLITLGDFLVQRGQKGDTEAALRDYTRGLELREKILQDNPNSTEAMRDVSVTLDRLGDFLVQRGQRGDAETALKHYTRSLELGEKTLQAHPDNGRVARDVSVALEKLGDFLAQSGVRASAEVALKDYTRSLELREKLLQASPDYGLEARDVSVTLIKLGDFLVQRGQRWDAETALKYYTRSLELSEKILQAHPGYGEATRDVSVALERLGDFLVRRDQPGDAEAALKHCTRSLELREKLLQSNPNSAQAVCDVALSLRNLSIYCRDRGDREGEERNSRACYNLLRERIATGVTLDPTIVQFFDELRLRFASGK